MSVLLDPVISLWRRYVESTLPTVLYVTVNHDFIYNGKPLEATGKFMLKSLGKLYYEHLVGSWGKI